MDLKRSQLVECIAQLAERAGELQENEISIVLYYLAGSCINKDDALAELADMCNILAKNQLLKMMAEEAGEQGTPLQ